jgi:hypothetical protein
MKKKKPSQKPLKSVHPVVLTADELKEMPFSAVHRRSKLNLAQEMVAKDIYKIMGKRLLGPYEEFELGFCYDTHPDRELVIWYRIAVCMILWRQLHTDFTPDQEKQVCTDLLSISSGAKGDKELTQLYLDSEQEVIKRLKELEETSQWRIV